MVVDSETIKIIPVLCLLNINPSIFSKIIRLEILNERGSRDLKYTDPLQSRLYWITIPGVNVLGNDVTEQELCKWVDNIIFGGVDPAMELGFP